MGEKRRDWKAEKLEFPNFRIGIFFYNSQKFQLNYTYDCLAGMNEVDYGYEWMKLSRWLA